MPRAQWLSLLSCRRFSHSHGWRVRWVSRRSSPRRDARRCAISLALHPRTEGSQSPAADDGVGSTAARRLRVPPEHSVSEAQAGVHARGSHILYREPGAPLHPARGLPCRAAAVGSAAALRRTGRRRVPLHYPVDNGRGGREGVDVCRPTPAHHQGRPPVGQPSRPASCRAPPASSPALARGQCARVVLDALGESVGADEDIAGFASCDDDQPSGESPAESESALVGGAAEREVEDEGGALDGEADEAAALLGCVSVLPTSKTCLHAPSSSAVNRAAVWQARRRLVRR